MHASQSKNQVSHKIRTVSSLVFSLSSHFLSRLIQKYVFVKRHFGLESSYTLVGVKF